MLAKKATKVAQNGRFGPEPGPQTYPMHCVTARRNVPPTHRDLGKKQTLVRGAAPAPCPYALAACRSSAAARRCPPSRLSRGRGAARGRRAATRPGAGERAHGDRAHDAAQHADGAFAREHYTAAQRGECANRRRAGVARMGNTQEWGDGGGAPPGRTEHRVATAPRTERERHVGRASGMRGGYRPARGWRVVLGHARAARG